MAWEGSTRRQRLPDDWPKRRNAALKAANGKCEARMSGGRRCGWKATDVDHIEAGDDHSPANLQAICSWHHGRKSSGEGNAAKAAKRQQTADKFRRTEEHPGLL